MQSVAFWGRMGIRVVESGGKWFKVVKLISQKPMPARTVADHLDAADESGHAGR